MDPEALPDHAVFQLTPTRTRCDLLIFSGGISEKIASGLVEPFVSHLKFAKDQLPKGGYSITLRPPTTDASSWFTKSTFQRFVRFVSTPEVLERFARLEREILQIESSVQSNEVANGSEVGKVQEGTLSTANGTSKHSTNASKLKSEIEGTDSAGQEENSKIQLQRLLETRKALLWKEQAMAYARALAAGFELDNIDDLLYFADAFGALRLREACTDFKDLCKKKHGDGLWMDELAAMEACSQLEQPYIVTPGIVLTCDSNGVFNSALASNGSMDLSTDSISSQANSDNSKDNNLPASDQMPQNATNVQMPMPWLNQISPYMFNFQKPLQNMPPYQAFPFPGMPPYYPGAMGWPPNMDEAGHGLTQRQRSSSRKKKSSNKEAPEEEEEQTESGESDSESDLDAHRLDSRRPSTKEQLYKKRHQKKSSKTVVIRNINYITSDKTSEEKDDDSSAEDELDEDSLRQVGDIIGSFEKHHKSTSNKKKNRSGHKNPSSVNGSNDSAHQELENDPVADKSKGGKGNGGWEAFQNLLMRDEEATATVENQQTLDVLNKHFTIKSSLSNVASTNGHSIDLASEKLQPKRNFGMDSFVVTERDEVNEGRVIEEFGNGERLRPSVKRRDCAEEELLFPRRSEGSGNILQETMSECASESSTIKHGNGEDWFIVNHSGKSETEATIERTIFEGNYALALEGGHSHVEKDEKIVPIDDSFMVQTQTSVDDQYDSQWKTDISMVSGINGASQTENGSADISQNKLDALGSHEPDDLCVMFARDLGSGSVGASWSSEMDYGIEISFMEADKRSSIGETIDYIQEQAPMNGKSTNVKNSQVPNNSGKQVRAKGLQGSLAKSKYDVVSRNKNPFLARKPTIQKSQLEKEEEARKKMEEQLIERQRRITERTAASGSFTPGASKKSPIGSKVASAKHDKKGITSPASKSGQLKKTNAR